MTDKRALDDTELDGLFASARAEEVVPSDNLIARILADAEAQASAPVTVTVAGRTGWLGTILGAIGGWPAAAGLATATVFGLAFGLSAPDTLDTLSGGYLAASGSAYELEDLMPSYAALLDEG